MRSSRPNLQRPFGMLLAPNLGEIDVLPHGTPEQCPPIHRRPPQGPAGAEVRGDLGQRPGTQHLDSVHHAGLGEVLDRHDHAPESVYLGGQGDGQRATHGTDFALQTQLSNDDVVR